ncbi:hypothetical protein [Verrucomicrobium sp. 3C]|uniref:hypothetical protein n=1 Tax=Verrucomicrobium sp. 3C TaxID=1134055 RepID=UPI00037F034B|nr:hypothetical protein [Verrucomicrobium sp. 3C]
MKKLNEKSLQSKLELETGLLAGDVAFRLHLDPMDDSSWWNHEHQIISVGVKDIAPERREELAWLIAQHEVGHTLFTARTGDKLDKKLFSIWNVLEDARIERRMAVAHGSEFGPLHEDSARRLYTGEGNPARSHPINAGILLRWKRWGVAGFDPDPSLPAEFLRDWDKSIDESIRAGDTAGVMKIATALREKWRSLFDPEHPSGDPSGLTERDQESMSGEGKPCEESKDTGNGSKSPRFFEWDQRWLQQEEAALRRYLVFPKATGYGYAYNGHRIDPRRAENPPLAPFRVRSEPQPAVRPFRMLAVIDASGSMNWKPFIWAAHTVKLLHGFLGKKLSVAVTGTQFTKPLEIDDLDDLRLINPNGGGENYRSLRERPFKERFTLFLSDACVGEKDAEFVKKLKALGCKIGCGYVGTQQTRLDKVFGEGISFQSAAPEGLGQMVGLFLKSRFGRELER